GDIDGALTQLNQALTADPANERAGVLKGDMLLQGKRDADSAIAKLRADAEALRDRADTLAGELAAARARAEESQSRAEDAEKRAADLETRLAGTVEELDGVRTEVGGLRRHLEEVLDTRTMRWTHQARELYSGLRRLRSRLFRG
ncbi:MAG: hypothetical protein Q8K72_07220, partial [Acidimicrobiales bacterium]|nr:hypothetical protein [Acidimicrobiales bacterium]